MANRGYMKKLPSSLAVLSSPITHYAKTSNLIENKDTMVSHHSFCMLLLCLNKFKQTMAMVGQKSVCGLQYHRSHVCIKNSSLLETRQVNEL